MLTNAQIAEKGQELIGCLQMWDISKSDSLVIAQYMAKRISDANEWINPLTGSGMKIATVTDTPIKTNINSGIN